MSENLVPLFNPLAKSFEFEWKDDNNDVHTLSLDPISITYFTKPQAHFMLKHLTDAVMAERGLNGINNVEEIKEIIKQIQVII